MEVRRGMEIKRDRQREGGRERERDFRGVMFRKEGQSI